MVGWHHWLDGHEFEQALGVGDGQRSLACCCQWGRQESDMTEQLNWTELIVFQLLSQDHLFVIPWTAAHEASLSSTSSWSLLKFMSSESVMLSNHLILYCPLLLLPSIFHSIRIFSNESGLRIRWPKYWNFSFSFSPSNEYSGLISFRIYWLDLLAVQETLKSLLQPHCSEAPFLWCSAFFRRRQWQPTPVFLPGKSHGWRSLVGCSP